MGLILLGADMIDCPEICRLPIFFHFSGMNEEVGVHALVVFPNLHYFFKLISNSTFICCYFLPLNEVAVLNMILSGFTKNVINYGAQF